jgi:iron complex transport system substrate-binding protein
MLRRVLSVATVIATIATASACGSGDDANSHVAAGSEHKPVTFKNCGVEVTVDATPERVVLLDSGGVTQLAAVGALDKVVATAGEYPTEYFDEQINQRLKEIPALTSAQTSVGGVDISLESIIDTEPDLVIGYETETVTREALGRSGIPMYVLPAYCDDLEKPSFKAVLDEVRLFGELFNQEAAARATIAELESQIDRATASPVVPDGTTGAALFVAGDESAIYAYTSQQLVDVQMSALGVTNVFADLKDFVPEISAESLIEQNPEILILLYTDTTRSPADVEGIVRKLPGADALTAVRNNALYPLLLNYSQPASPLTVEGLQQMRDRLAA